MSRFANHIFLSGLVLAISLFLPSKAEADRLTPGVRISNQAQVNYLNPETFESVDLLSNEVSVIVTGVGGIELQRDQTLTADIGESFQFLHQLTNTGNTAGNFTIFTKEIENSDFP